ncbi:LysR substrate-binding domain-containing protein [Cupriavidus basilensis]
MVLSEFGKRIIPEIELLLAQSARLQDEVRNAAGVPAGMVRIGVLPSMTRRLIPALFADLRDTAPSRPAACRGKASAASSMNNSIPATWTLLSSTAMVRARARTRMYWRPWRTTWSAHRTIRSRHGLPSNSDDWTGCHWYCRPRPTGCVLILDQHARQQGVTLDVALEVESLNAMKAVALAGHALTILPQLAVDEEVASGRLAAAEIVKPQLPRSISLGLTQHHPLSRAARVVLSRLHELVPRVTDRDVWPGKAK